MKSKISYTYSPHSPSFWLQSAQDWCIGGAHHNEEHARGGGWRGGQEQYEYTSSKGGISNLNINSRVIVNPFIIQAYINIIIIMLYGLHWSELLPSLTNDLIFFIFFTSYIMLSIGLLSTKSVIIPKYKPIYMTHNPSIVMFMLIILITIEFIYNRGIPLLLLINGSEYDYTSFGIKTLHVFILTFISFYTVYLSHLFISRRDKKILFYIIILCFYHVLIVSRYALFMVVISVIFVFIMAIKSLNYKYLIIILFCVIILMYGFGILGNIRHGSESFFTHVSHPSKEFFDSNVPSEFLWAYMYITSPLGNLQITINNVKVSYSVREFIMTCLIPDFISKHFNFNKTPISQISPVFNVSTMYGSAYASMGWLGMAAIFIYTNLLILLYLICLPRNTPYTISGVALITTCVAFNFFTNMFVYTGAVMQLVYPILFGYIFKIMCDKHV